MKINFKYIFLCFLVLILSQSTVSYGQNSTLARTKRVQQEAVRLIDQGDLNKAEKLLKAEIASTPNNPYALATLGHIYYLIGSYAEAEKYSSKASKLFSVQDKSSRVYNYTILSKIYKELGMSEKVLEVANYGLSIEPSNLHLLWDRFWIYFFLGRYKEALKDADMFIKVDPTNHIGYLNKYSIYVTTKQRQASIEVLNQGLEKVKEDANILYYARASSHKEIGQHSLAIDDIIHALSITRSLQYDSFLREYFDNQSIISKLSLWQQSDKSNILPSYYLAEVHLHQGNYQEALKYISQAENLNLRIFVLESKKNILSRMGNLAGVQECINRIIDMKAIDANDYSVKAKTYEEVGEQYDKAIEAINEAIILTPKEDRYYAQRGMIRMKMKLWDEAINDYSRAIMINDKKSSYYIRRGIAREHFEDYKGARSDYEIALEMNPQPSEKGVAEFALSRLQHREKGKK